MSEAALQLAGPAVQSSEAELLKQHVAGDGLAFRELVQRYRSPVFGYLCRCGVAAEDRDDLFQEIFIRVHRAASSFDPSRELHPWLFTIVANVVRTYLRRRRVRSLMQRNPAHADPVDPGPDGERSAVARETVGRLEKAISRLPLVKREVVLLACVEKLPLKQVAETLGLPLNTVKTHLRRARLSLARTLAAGERGEVKP